MTTESSTGSTSSTRVHTNLTLRVTSTDFDVGSGQLHVSGRVAEENKYVKLGGFHTLDLELQRPFTLEKADGWDSVAVETLKESVDATKRAELWAVVMQEGLANICLITEHQTILRQRVEVPIPKKRSGGIGDHEKATAKFFATLLATLLRQLDLSADAQNAQKPLLLAGPGFTAQAFQAHMRQAAASTADKALQALLAGTVVVHASSGHPHALAEVLKAPAVLARLRDAKYARETQLLDAFGALLRRDDGRAWYGPREVERAVDKGAVGRGGGVLLISNGLFRAQDVAERRRWVALVDRVREVEGGEVRVLSSLHESGKRLEGLGGVAAILTFPLADLDEDEEGVEVEGGAGGGVGGGGGKAVEI